MNMQSLSTVMLDVRLPWQPHLLCKTRKQVNSVVKLDIVAKYLEIGIFGMRGMYMFAGKGMDNTCQKEGSQQKCYSILSF